MSLDKNWLVAFATVGGTHKKFGRSVWPTFQNPYYFWQKAVIFLTIFMTLPRIQLLYPIYGRCGWHSCPKHNLWRAFVDGLIKNDEKVASSKNLTQFKTLVQKPPSVRYLWPKRKKNLLRLCIPTVYSLRKGVPPPPPPWGFAAFNFCWIVQVVNVTIWLNHPFALVDLLI